MSLLNGKVALVTGASRGIGRAIAERLAQDGASVVVNYAKSAGEAEKVVAEIEAKGGSVVAIQADVRNVSNIRRLFKEAFDRYGRLDIVVANAGIFLEKPLAEVTEQEFDDIFNLNAKGAFFTLQEAARRISDGGRIVAISTGGTRLGFPGAAAYLGTKGALDQFTKTLAMELGPRGVTVNAVSPGFTETDMLSKEEFRQMGIQMSPLGRLGTAQDIADAVAFVVSEQGRWITGGNLQVGGGVVMG
jgi:3-oxoacyl-[acyl-carrier protein] reductase